MKTLVVIPARYASSRFPGKPLALLGGKPIVQWVWEGVCDGSVDAMVATDDERIARAVAGFGGKEMLTSPQCQSGTDRCGEVMEKLSREGRCGYEVVVNVQGDEPFVAPSQWRSLVEVFADPQVQIATLRTPIRTTAELLSPNNVKVVADDNGNALYFSRQPIPYRRGAEPQEWLASGTYYKHVGIYAYRAEVLKELCGLPVGELEACEKLEQLRWLAAGYRIRLVDTPHANIGIDTPADLAEAERIVEQKKDTLR